jgi:MFS transporter, AAHS family, benzoate transport protein
MPRTASASTSPARSTSARRVLLLCLLAVVFEGFDMVAYGVTLPAMLDDPSWGLTPARAGVVGSYALIGMLVGSLLVGAIADLLGRRWLMIGATAWFSAWSGVCAVAPDATLFGLARFFVGAGVGALIPLAASMAVESRPGARAIHTAPSYGPATPVAECSPPWSAWSSWTPSVPGRCTYSG